MVIDADGEELRTVSRIRAGSLRCMRKVDFVSRMDDISGGASLKSACSIWVPWRHTTMPFPNPSSAVTG